MPSDGGPPPLEATPASRALGEHAGRIYAELGRKLAVDTVAEGGGTDAAFASVNTKAPVLERFGLRGFGAHSNDAEYVALDSIEPRLYLLARLIMDVSEGKDRRGAGREDFGGQGGMGPVASGRGRSLYCEGGGAGPAVLVVHEGGGPFRRFHKAVPAVLA